MERCPCCENAVTEKGAWTKEEDGRLIAHIQAHGEGRWKSIPKAAGLLRCGKSCQLRWINCLLPDLTRWNISEEEEELIIKLHALLGNRWSLIAGRLPVRTDNEIKNYWNTHIKRKLLKRGIDPRSQGSVLCVENDSSSSNNHSLNHEIHTQDFFPHDGSGKFEDASLNRNDEPPNINLELCISLPSYDIETVDSEEVSK